jgi:hypothetical protein
LLVLLAAGAGLASGLSFSPAHADSVFSAHGLGEVVTPADVRGRGMGGASVAVDDEWNLSRINPALLSGTRGFTLHVELISELRKIEDRSGESWTPRSVNFPLFRLALPVPRLGALGIGIFQYTDVSYVFRREDGFGNSLLTQTLRGKNGLNTLGLTFARRVRPELEVGIDMDVMLGSYVDIWTNRFEDRSLRGSVDSLVVNHSRGPVIRVGALGRPHPRLRLGAALTFGRDIEARPEVSGSDQETRFLPTEQLHLPTSLALGISGDIDKHWRAAADLVHTRWETTDLTLGSDPILNRFYVPTIDVTRIAIGVEYLGDRTDEARGLRQRMPLRAGYAWEPWHFRDAFGEKIIDQFVTAGVGIPLPERAGFLDLAVEFGYRGDRDENGARERVIRLGLGLPVREWVSIGRLR